MAERFGSAIGWTVDHVVRWIVLPVTGVIPVLAETGILVAAFGALWLAFAAAIVLNPDMLTETWRWVGSWPLLLQAVAWVLFLPLMVGLWIWQTDWAFLIRVLLIGGIAVWNVIVFMPKRQAAKTAEAVR